MPPVGATTGCAGFCAAKTELKTRRAGVLAGGPRLSKAKARQAKTSAPVGPMTGRAVSRSEMRPNGSKRRGASAGPAVEQRNVPRQTPREYAGPHSSKAKMG